MLIAKSMHGFSGWLYPLSLSLIYRADCEPYPSSNLKDFVISKRGLIAS